eukprot:6490501-Amphidinium_carterae.2
MGTGWAAGEHKQFCLCGDDGHDYCERTKPIPFIIMEYQKLEGRENSEVVHRYSVEVRGKAPNKS